MLFPVARKSSDSYNNNLEAAAPYTNSCYCFFQKVNIVRISLGETQRVRVGVLFQKPYVDATGTM